MLGNRLRSVDDKGRITLPSKMRASLKESLFVVAYNPILECLEVWPYSKWQKIERPCHIDQVALDKSGRILLHQWMLGVAAIKDKVRVLGVGDHFEIWNPAKFEVYTAHILKEMLRSGKTV